MLRRCYLPSRSTHTLDPGLVPGELPLGRRQLPGRTAAVSPFLAACAFLIALRCTLPGRFLGCGPRATFTASVPGPVPRADRRNGRSAADALHATRHRNGDKLRPLHTTELIVEVLAAELLVGPLPQRRLVLAGRPGEFEDDLVLVAVNPERFWVSEREIDLVSSWSSPPGWAVTGGHEEPPGGAGSSSRSAAAPASGAPGARRDHRLWQAVWWPVRYVRRHLTAGFRAPVCGAPAVRNVVATSRRAARRKGQRTCSSGQAEPYSPAAATRRGGAGATEFAPQGTDVCVPAAITSRGWRPPAGGRCRWAGAPTNSPAVRP